MEILLCFMPAVALCVYNLFYYKPGEQLFYIGVDSLILVAYAIALITITLGQRERIVNSAVLFDWKELLRCDLGNDKEGMYEVDDDQPLKNQAVKVMATFEEDFDDDRGDFKAEPLKDCKFFISIFLVILCVDNIENV